MPASVGGELADRAGIRDEQQVRRRDEYEMLGLLFVILGTLVVLAVTVGQAPRF